MTKDEVTTSLRGKAKSHYLGERVHLWLLPDGNAVLTMHDRRNTTDLIPLGPEMTAKLATLLAPAFYDACHHDWEIDRMVPPPAQFRCKLCRNPMRVENV